MVGKKADCAKPGVSSFFFKLRYNHGTTLELVVVALLPIMLLTLPLEIICQIIEDVVGGINDLIYSNYIWVLSLSCRLLRDEAQRVLFRDPLLLARSTYHNKTIMLLDTIISSPDRLALYVQTFKIGFVNWSRPNSDEFVKKLSSALQAMHNLKSLAVDNRLDSILSLPIVLEGVHFKLNSFWWAGPPDGVSSVASVKADFLQHQDEIEHLSISAFIGEITSQPIAADICPRLRSLSAPYKITKLLLPNKKYVTSLQWVLPLDERAVPEDFHIDGVDLISNELENLRFLSYEDCSAAILPCAPLLQDIAPYLKALVCLETAKRDIEVSILKYCILEMAR